VLDLNFREGVYMQYLGVVGLGISALTGSLSDKDPLIQNIDFKVIKTIEHSENVPGLKSDEFNSIKKGVKELWTELVKRGVIEITATDKEIRPYFVALQGIIEHVLASELGEKNLQSLTGVIHTPMPATPFCTEGSISNELVDPSITGDPLRLFTVKARTTIMRDYLFQGGDLYVVYPKDGINKRNEIQQQVYKNELTNYPTHLFDCPLDCESIPEDLIGAFYLFRNNKGKLFAFAIKMTQANNPQDLGGFGLWFAEFGNSGVNDRISNVWSYILKYSSQPIALPL
jgi:hypothetical protein